ncbi:MAG: hypothetical protein NTV23_04495 [Propionibacteriales bacterium]|nr:hypothetical protein [Propionibacteriales bacterium]
MTDPEDRRVTDPQPPGRIKDIRVYRDAFVGMGMLACIPFLIWADPVYGVWTGIALSVVWALLLAQGTRWFMPHPRWVIYLAVAAFGLWLVAVVLNR